jgi:dipeptidyl aminopeptidase/acylaminoacyl peptidase
VLLAYGGHDRIVNVDQGRDLAKQLQKQGKKYELIIEKHEGHGFQSETNQVKLFQRIEAFLKENL